MGDNKWLRNSFVYVIIMAEVLVLLFVFLGQNKGSQEVTISEVVAQVKAGAVDTITTHEDSNRIEVKFKEASKPPVVSTRESQESMAKYLEDQGVSQLPTIKVEPANSWG